MSINSSKRTGKDNLTKPAVQSQLARLKREEEEELWISGEELCTEGSSDEEDSKTCSRSSYRTNRNHDSRNSSSSGRHHWIVADNTKEISERLNSNSEIKNTILSSTEIINSSEVDTSHTQSNSSIKSEMNVSMTDDTSCSVVTQDEEEGESLKDSEISWKVNRDISTKGTQEGITELKELTQLDYQREFCARLRESLQIKDYHDNIGRAYLRNNINKCQLKNISTINEELKKNISNVESLDTAIKKFDNNIEKEMKRTLLCQYKNRERLKEILKNVPLETGKLAKNTQQFFSLYNEYSGVPVLMDEQERIKQNEMHETEISSYNQQMSINKEVNEINIHEQLLKARQKRNKSIKKNNTLKAYPSKISHKITYEKKRMAILFKNVIDNNDNIIHTSNNPYCFNDEEKKSLCELCEKISVLQTDVTYKNCKEPRIQKHMLLTSDINNTNVINAPVSTVSTISTLQDVHEDILMELLQDSKIITASSTDDNEKRQITAATKEI